MKYTEETVIFGQDVDMNGNLRPAALLAKLEDAGSRQMEVCPPSNEDLRARDMAFIVSRIVMRIYKEVPEGSTATAETWATDSRGLTHNRCYRLLVDGGVAAEVYSSWALLNFAERRLLRVGETERLGGEPEPPLTLDLPVRVRMPAAGEYECAGTRAVYFSDADRNGHMNNTKYLSMLCDFVPDILHKPLRGINISYVSEAPFGETLTVYRHADGDSYYFKTVRTDGKINCEAVLYF